MNTPLTALLCATLPGVALANGGLTLDEAVSAALAYNPRVRAATASVHAARAGVGAARALGNPEIVFTPGLTSAAGSDEEFVIEQPLELNGTRSARTGVARAELERRRAGAEIGLGRLAHDTKVAYWELARSQAELALAGELLQIAEAYGHGVARRVEEGLERGADRAQTAIETSRARQRTILAESNVRIAAARLNSLMGQPAQALIEPLPPVTLEPVNVDAEAAIATAIAQRAEIRAQEASGAALSHEARLVRAEGRADVVPHVRAESIVRERSGIGVGVGVRLPFIDHGSRRKRARQISALAEAQDARSEAVRIRIRQEVVQALSRLGAAEARVREYEQGTLTQARWLLDAHLKGAELGAPDTSVLTVLEAQRTFSAIQEGHTDALIEHAIAKAELEWALGGALPRAAGGDHE